MALIAHLSQGLGQSTKFSGPPGKDHGQAGDLWGISGYLGGGRQDVMSGVEGDQLHLVTPSLQGRSHVTQTKILL
jgi:hypothetical protein